MPRWRGTGLLIRPGSVRARPLPPMGRVVQRIGHRSSKAEGRRFEPARVLQLRGARNRAASPLRNRGPSIRPPDRPAILADRGRCLHRGQIRPPALPAAPTLANPQRCARHRIAPKSVQDRARPTCKASAGAVAGGDQVPCFQADSPRAWLNAVAVRIYITAVSEKNLRLGAPLKRICMSWRRRASLVGGRPYEGGRGTQECVRYYAASLPWRWRHRPRSINSPRWRAAIKWAMAAKL